VGGSADSVRIERGFIGAHSDIGGGYCGDGSVDCGDLSDVALKWMYEQMRIAEITLKPLEPDQTRVSNPIVHDETRVAPWNLPGLGGLSDDREVRFPDSTVKQKDALFAGGMSYAEAEAGQYINRLAEANRQGTVDMVKYRQWLQENLGVTIQ
jgi:hypothetical protein